MFIGLKPEYEGHETLILPKILNSTSTSLNMMKMVTPHEEKYCGQQRL